jgi:thiol-disulfide isomerase/thioredoxin
MIGVIVVAGVLTLATAGGLLLRRHDGRFRPVPSEGDGPMLAALGYQAGTPLTLIQFSSAFCAPCRATRVLCADVAATVPGVRHVEVDAESHLDAVRSLNILRTPTVLLVDAEGEVRKRASGPPTRAQLLAAVAALLPSPNP